jgi:serine/threonine protein phosphatase PrpC
MDITKYLTNIELPGADEVQVKAFLASKGNALHDNILKLWDDFILTENEKTIAVADTHGSAAMHGRVSLPESQSEPTDIVQNTEPAIQKTPLVSDEESVAASEIELPDNENKTIPADAPVDNSPKEDLKEKAQNEELALLIKNKFITLPNGKVGQPYNFVFSTEKIGLAEIEDFWFADLEPIGLSFDPETDAITGTPKVAGEQSIQLFLKRKGWTEGKPVFERKLTLTVNPDPRSLWQDKLSDKNDPYWKPDSDSRFLKVESTGILLKTERKDVVAASQRGRSHAHEGIFRDDDFGMDYDKNTNWYIITVADGAGSCKASRKGSQIACQTVVNVCKAQLESQHKDFEHLIKELSKDRSDANRKKMGDALYGIVGTAVFKAYKNIEEEATKSGRAVKDFSTTLIVSICKKFKFGWFVGAFWVGDGGIGIYNKDTKFLKVLGESDGGEFAGQTRFLTMPEITQPAELYRRLRFDIVDEFTALILMTDGITDPKFETDANLLKFEKWEELWADLSKEVEFKDNNEKSAEQLLKWLDFWSPGNHDDRTIAILF